MNPRAGRGVLLTVRVVVLAALGAVATFPLWSGKKTNTVGLITNDPRAFQGYTLLAPIFSTATYLLDIEGRVVKTWQSEYEPGQVACLLENGHLLRAGSLARHNPAFKAGGGIGGRVQEFSWDGELLWDFEFSSDDHLLHHDVAVLPNGNVLMIAWEKKTAQQAIAAGRNPELQGEGELWPDFLIEVHPTGKTTGEIVWQWRVWDHLIQDHDSAKANYGDVAAHPERIDLNHCYGWTDQLTNKELDKLKSLGYLGTSAGRKQRANPEWTHTNAIAYNARLDQVVLSVLGFNEFWVIDHSTTTEQARGAAGGRYGKGGDLLYRWGNPQAYRAGTAADQRLFAQHNAHWIPPGLAGEGHFLVFNNGRHRTGGDYSSVDEIVPPVGEDGLYAHPPRGAFAPGDPVWSYTAPDKASFYSMHISGAQRLPNGNTLICSGANGTLFEVTPDKNVVWKYINPISRANRPSPVESKTHGGGADRPPPKEGSKKDAGKKDEATNTVFRAYRYPPDYPGLAGKDLTPGERLTDL